MLNSSSLRTGRRGGASDTRAAILKAARKLFAGKGYDATSFRAVAAAARVDPALVVHFFGSKDQLFGQSLELPVDPEAIARVLDGDRAGLGRRLATFYVKTVFHERAGTMLSLLRSVGNPEACAMLRRAIESALVATFERLFDGGAGFAGDGRRPQAAATEAALRGELVASHMMGLFFARRIVGVEPLASADDERLIEIVAPALQHYLTAPLPKRKRK